MGRFSSIGEYKWECNFSPLHPPPHPTTHSASRGEEITIEHIVCFTPRFIDNILLRHIYDSTNRGMAPRLSQKSTKAGRFPVRYLLLHLVEF